MSFIVNWHGDPIEIAESENLRSTKTSTFKAANGITTYFPLPMSFMSLVKVIGRYKIPSAFNDRPDLIAKELYGSEDLWWLIYWSNEVIDPFASLKTGDLLNIIDIVSFKTLFNRT